jgi:hypothetical protein
MITDLMKPVEESRDFRLLYEIQGPRRPAVREGRHK